MKSRHVALLRGINVGGNNIIKMVDLRARFEDMGFTDVVTYIQSGNVVFSSRAMAKSKMTKAIEDALSKAFGYESVVVVVSSKELDGVIEEAPKGFGKQPDKYRHDVLFVKEPATPKEALAQVSLKAGVDDVYEGKHVLYFRRLIARATQSHLPRLVQKPIYKVITIRNWNTTMKLQALASQE